MLDDRFPALLTRRAVQARVGISKATLYRWISDGLFPAPLQIGPRAVRWSERELEEWLASRPRGSGQAAASR